ncbi:MAG TPA: hypothetical protein VGS22_23830 [Thermoanaerobaculia bacterium]|jgi:hypothetical protein|nr:hypothetical protein [Thermoanaerobaculia bacterium]
MRLNRSFLLASLVLASVTTVSASAQTRPDQTLRSTMTSGFRTAATQHGVVADLPSLGLTSSAARFSAVVGIPQAGGIDDVLAGEPFALLYLNGGTPFAPGYYRAELGTDRRATLRTASGATVAMGTASLDLTANPGTNFCEFEQPDPNDDHLVCLSCLFSSVAGPWAINTCFTF